jgi:hypothetical protein
MSKELLPYFFLYNFNFENELIKFYGNSFNMKLSKDVESNAFLSVFDFTNKYVGFNYNYSSWNNNYDIDLVYNKLIYINYEYMNKLVNNRIRYVKFSRNLLEESCLLYLRKHIIKTDIIDNDRLISCYKDCVRIRDVWSRYLLGYGKMYIMEINLSDNTDYNLLKLSRFIGRSLIKIDFTLELDERINLLMERLRKLLVKL